MKNQGKRLVLLISLIFLCLGSTSLFANSKYIVVVYDASASMLDRFVDNGHLLLNTNKDEVGKQSLTLLIDGLEGIQDALRKSHEELYSNLVLFGHRQTRHCSDNFEWVYPEKQTDLNQIKTKIMEVQPHGSTPLYYVLQSLHEHLSQVHGNFDKKAIIITDGLDQCGGGNIIQFFNSISQDISYQIDWYMINPPQSQSLKELEHVTNLTNGHLVKINDLNLFKTQISNQIRGLALEQQETLQVIESQQPGDDFITNMVEIQNLVGESTQEMQFFKQMLSVLRTPKPFVNPDVMNVRLLSAYNLLKGKILWSNGAGNSFYASVQEIQLSPYSPAYYLLNEQRYYRPWYVDTQLQLESDFSNQFLVPGFYHPTAIILGQTVYNSASNRKHGGSVVLSGGRYIKTADFLPTVEIRKENDDQLRFQLELPQQIDLNRTQMAAQAIPITVKLPDHLDVMKGKVCFRLDHIATRLNSYVVLTENELKADITFSDSEPIQHDGVVEYQAYLEFENMSLVEGASDYRISSGYLFYRKDGWTKTALFYNPEQTIVQIDQQLNFEEAQRITLNKVDIQFKQIQSSVQSEFSALVLKTNEQRIQAGDEDQQLVVSIDITVPQAQKEYFRHNFKPELFVFENRIVQYISMLSFSGQPEQFTEHLVYMEELSTEAEALFRYQLPIDYLPSNTQLDFSFAIGASEEGHRYLIKK